MPTGIYIIPPICLGAVSLTLGIAVLLASAKIVAWNILVLGRLHCSFLGLVSQASETPLALKHDALLWKAARFSYWLVTLLFGFLLTAFGAAVLLHIPLTAQSGSKAAMSGLRNHVPTSPAHHVPEPFWHGLVFLAIGAGVLLASPKLVEAGSASNARINRWLLGLVGYDADLYLSQNANTEESPLDRWRRSGQWIGLLLFAAMMITFGIEILLGHVYSD